VIAVGSFTKVRRGASNGPTPRTSAPLLDRSPARLRCPWSTPIPASVSHGHGGRSTNRAVRRERGLDVADLSAMPKGRAVVFASGAPATLVRTLPWMLGPRVAEVRASIAEHDPAADVTITEAMQSLSDVQSRGARLTRQHAGQAHHPAWSADRSPPPSSPPAAPRVRQALPRRRRVTARRPRRRPPRRPTHHTPL